MRFRTLLLSCLLPLGGWLCLSAPSPAQIIDWTGGGASDDYDDPGNWVGGQVPDTSTESARFSLATGFTVYDVFMPLSDIKVDDVLALNGSPRLQATGSSDFGYIVSDDFILSGSANVDLLGGSSGGVLDVSVGNNLRVDGDSTLDIGVDANVYFRELLLANISGAGDGVIRVEGGFMRQFGSSPINIGQDGLGSLTFTDGSTGDLSGVVQLAHFATAPGIGRLNIDNGSELDLGELQIAAAGSNGGVASSTTREPDSETRIASSLTIGNNTAGGPAGTLTAHDGGLVTVAGATTINDSGELKATSNASGIISGDGPGVVRIDGPTSMTGDAQVVVDGGIATLAGGLSNPAGGRLAVAEGLLEFTGGTVVSAGWQKGSVTAFHVNSLDSVNEITATVRFATGDSVQLLHPLWIGSSQHGEARFEAGTQATVSEVRMGSPQLAIGTGEGYLVVQDPGTELAVAGLVSVNRFGSGDVRVENGGRITSGTTHLATDVNSTTSPLDGRVLVTGAGSEWINTGTFQVGDDDNDTTPVVDGAQPAGLLEIAAGGRVDAGSLLEINASGKVIINGGVLQTDAIDNSHGGVFDFRTGEIQFDNSLTIGNGELFPVALALGPAQKVTTPGVTTVEPGRSIALNGGALDTQTLTVQGDFQFLAGELTIGSGGITGLDRLSVPSAASLIARGSLSGMRFSSVAGSQVLLSGQTILGNRTSPAGAYVGGELNLDGYRLTLEDSNGATIDSGAFVELQAGELLAINGLAIDFGATVVDEGLIDTPNDPARPVINNGHLIGASTRSPITLTGYVKGVGTCDNCLITGTDAPGFSPANVVRGSVAYRGELQIEVGGTGSSEFDRIDHLLGSGVIDLGGQLTVELIDGYTPSAGDEVLFMTSIGGVLNKFDMVDLPADTGGLAWSLQYGETIVSLAVAGVAGDYNYDGLVDAADYTVWRDALGQTGDGLAADGDQNGVVEQADYDVWRANYGATGAEIATAVPEPTGWLLLTLAAIPVFRRR